MFRTLVSVLPLLVTGWAWGSTYTVTTNADAGVGSLRWAIGQANNHAGADEITFAGALSSQQIMPQSVLPAITDAYTSVLGDTNADGLPDVLLNGLQAGVVAGLTVQADDCVIEGLAIISFGGVGLLVQRADECVVRYCHVGVNRPGTKMYRNGLHQIKLWLANGSTIGRGDTGGAGNIIAAGSATGMLSGIYVANSTGNAIRNNNIGVAHDGKTLLGGYDTSGVGITLTTTGLLPSETELGQAEAVVLTRDNLIGGRVGDRNVIGGMQVGIDIAQANGNLVSANYLGVGRDGTTSVRLDDAIRIRRGSSGNRVGPQDNDETRYNVFWNDAMGVNLYDAGTEGNTVDGNRFTRRVTGKYVGGILCRDGAGSQTFERNVFGGDYSPITHTNGVYLSAAGGGSRIADNQFCRSVLRGVSVAGGAGAEVLNNRFTGCTVGIDCHDAPHATRVQDNSFRSCAWAVSLLGNSTPLLGRQYGGGEDLGRNCFYASNQWYIRNLTANNIMAEGNRFPGGLLNPHVKIMDHQDSPTYGVVDIDPVGPSLPTLGSTGGLPGRALVMLQVRG